MYMLHEINIIGLLLGNLFLVNLLEFGESVLVLAGTCSYKNIVMDWWWLYDMKNSFVTRKQHKYG